MLVVVDMSSGAVQMLFGRADCLRSKRCRTALISCITRTWQTRPILGRGKLFLDLAQASEDEISALIDSQICPHCSPADERAPSVYSASVAQIEVLSKTPAMLYLQQAVCTQPIAVEIDDTTRRFRSAKFRFGRVANPAEEGKERRKGERFLWHSSPPCHERGYGGIKGGSTSPAR